MRSYILFTVLILAMQTSTAQKNFIAPGAVNESFVKQITATCNKEVKKWSYADGIAIRHYDNGFDYTLIDTAGLFIYIKDGKDAFYSLDACGEIYRLNYYALKRSFRAYVDFSKALKLEKDDALALPAAKGNITLVNSLYKKYVQGHEIKKMTPEE